MGKYTIEQIRPMPGWALCRSLVATNTTGSGLIMARPSADMETGKTSECVAEVLAVTPRVLDNGREVDPLFKVGDRIIIRDFLKFANQVGDLVGADRPDRVFLLNNPDAFAIVEGSGKLGFYGEYVLE